MRVAKSLTKGTLRMFVSTLSRGRHIKERIHEQSELQQKCCWELVSAQSKKGVEGLLWKRIK